MNDRMREEFEAWWNALYKFPENANPDDKESWSLVWQAACRAQAKRDAEMCRVQAEEFNAESWDSARLSKEIGAMQCAIAIKKDAGL